MAKRIANVTISEELLCQFFRFPPGTRIRACRRLPDSRFQLQVLHPDLEEVQECYRIPDVEPQWTRYDDLIQFTGWGQLAANHDPEPDAVVEN